MPKKPLVILLLATELFAAHAPKKQKARDDSRTRELHYRNCRATEGRELYPEQKEKRVFFSEPLAVNDGKASAAFQVMDMNGQPDPASALHFVSAKKANKQGAIIWEGSHVKTETQEARQIDVIQVGGKNPRNVFVVSSPNSSDLWHSYGDYGGYGRNVRGREVQVFDDQGNFAEIQVYETDTQPPQRYFAATTVCSTKGLQTPLGFIPSPQVDLSTLYLNQEGPNFPNAELIQHFPKAKRTISVKYSDTDVRNEEREDTLLATGDTQILKGIQTKILSDKANLSPALQAFATSLTDGKYKTDPEWQLRSLITSSIRIAAQ